MKKKIKIEIKSWLNGSILFEYEAVDNTIAKTVEKAVASSANLSYANLRYADLRYANLSSANLSSANLRYADLSSADLSSADLSSANLRYADLRSANLRSADLSSADLSSANLSSANLRSANLRYADLSSAENVNRYYITDLSILTMQKNRLTAYKYLTKDMESPVQSTGKIKYEKGKIYKEIVNTDRFEDCAAGLNIASLEWCLRETQGNLDDYKYIEVSFDPKDLVMPYWSDGKFRVSKLKVERILTKKELKPFTEVIK